MNIRVLRDQVAIRRDKAAEVSEGGIMLGEKDKELPDIGTIVSVGPGKILEDGTTRPMSVKIDDRVVFANGAGEKITINKETLFLVNEQDIVGILT